MPESRLRAGIAGCGRIAGAFAHPGVGPPLTHAGALTADGAFVLDAVWDADAARAEAFAARWHAAAVVAGPAGLAARALDLVAVCTPDASHAPVVLELLAAPVPPRLIGVEKPLCTRPDDLARLERALAACPGVSVVVNHSRRFDAGHAEVQAVIASGRLGPVLAARWVYYGGWLHNGVHAVDTLRLLLGGGFEPLEVEPGWLDRPGDPCLDGRFRSSAWPDARIVIESHPETAYQMFEGEIRLGHGRIRVMDFGAELWLDDVKVNEAGERELKSGRRLTRDDAPPAMANLYRQAAGWLGTGDCAIVARAGLAEAAATLRLLFDTAARLIPASHNADPSRVTDRDGGCASPMGAKPRTHNGKAGPGP